MKIFYFIPAITSAGGMERTLILKANYLTDILNYDVTIITTEKESTTIPFFIISDKVKIVRLNIGFSEHFSKSFLLKILLHYKKLCLYRRQTELLLTKEKPDICVSLLGKEVAFLPHLKDGSKKIGESHFAKDYSKQLILARHSAIWWRLYASFSVWHLECMVAKFDHFVVLTKHDIGLWSRVTNISCIPNANPLGVQSTNYNILSKEVISVGHYFYEKGYERLISAWKNVKVKHPDWKLRIFGDGELREKYESIIKKLDLQDVVILNYPVRNILSEYKKSSFYVMSSRSEGLPMVLIEAMSCGLPCIAFDIRSSMKDIISHQIDGILVKEGDIELFANAIIELIENDEKRKIMSLNAFEKSKLYDIENIMSMWIQLFDS